MILLKEEKIKLFSYENCKNITKEEIREEKIEKLKYMIREYEEEENYEYMECPDCKSDRLIRYGTYERNIGIYGKYIKIRIKRVKCKKCNKTHALIPSFIIPYFQNEISFIEVGITLKEVEKERIVEISKKLTMSRQLLLFWLKRFKSHLTRLKTTISNNIETIMTSLFDGIKIRNEYKIKNNLNFLEKVPT